MIRFEVDLPREAIIDIFCSYIHHCYGINVNRAKLKIDMPRYMNFNFVNHNPNHPADDSAGAKQSMTLTIEEEHTIQ